MIRRGALLAVGLVVLLAAGWLSATGAEAAAPPCATRAESAALRLGMAPSSVEAVVGFKGRRQPVVPAVPKWDIPASLAIEYRVCGGGQPLVALFDDRDGGMWRLRLKIAPWHPHGYGD